MKDTLISRNVFLAKSKKLFVDKGNFVNLRSLELEDLEILKKWRNNNMDSKTLVL